MKNQGIASFFVRISLGLFVDMLGYQKVFIIGPYNHANNFFIEGLKEHWIPEWLSLGQAQ